VSAGYQLAVDAMVTASPRPQMQAQYDAAQVYEPTGCAAYFLIIEATQARTRGAGWMTFRAGRRDQVMH
jgi:hypothetical protein